MRSVPFLPFQDPGKDNILEKFERMTCEHLQSVHTFRDLGHGKSFCREYI